MSHIQNIKSITWTLVDIKLSKALLKEFMPNELKTFRTLHKQLGNKIRQQVYELGFLK